MLYIYIIVIKSGRFTSCHMTYIASCITSLPFTTPSPMASWDSKVFIEYTLQNISRSSWSLVYCFSKSMNLVVLGFVFHILYNREVSIFVCSKYFNSIATKTSLYCTYNSLLFPAEMTTGGWETTTAASKEYWLIFAYAITL